MKFIPRIEPLLSKRAVFFHILCVFDDASGGGGGALEVPRGLPLAQALQPQRSDSGPGSEGCQHLSLRHKPDNTHKRDGLVGTPAEDRLPVDVLLIPSRKKEKKKDKVLRKG